jgi:hypothetical protein
MREIVDLLIRSRIPFMIIGGHALGLHGAQRDTVDLDCVVVAEQREEMKAFLESRGFEETARHAVFSRYQHRSLLYPILDLMQVDANTWEEMWVQSIPKTIKNLAVRVPGISHLVALKLHAIRQNSTRELQDGADIVRLLRANPDVISEEQLRNLCERYQLERLFATLKTAIWIPPSSPH